MEVGGGYVRKFKSNRGLGSGVWRTIALLYVRIVNDPEAFRKLHPEESTTLKSVEVGSSQAGVWGLEDGSLTLL